MHQLTAEIIAQLQGLACEEKRKVYVGFFKTGKGQYGYGDCFLGVTVPLTRKVVKQYREASLEVVSELLKSKWHECRLCGLLILVYQYQRAEKAQQKGNNSDANTRCEELFKFYLANTSHINNWDLVDLSAPYIIGPHLLSRPRDILYKLAQSSQLWQQRIAVVATLGLIRKNDFIDTIRLAEYFSDKGQEDIHDLMQKAVGWMLREVGKRNLNLLVEFLNKHASTMPRTMLRYAIEKFQPEERLNWMKRKQ